MLADSTGPKPIWQGRVGVANWPFAVALQHFAQPIVRPRALPGQPRVYALWQPGSHKTGNSYIPALRLRHKPDRHPQGVGGALAMCRIPYSARLVAGFCWPWSNPDSSGQLVDDVKLDGFSMPWNAMPDAGKLAPGIPKSNFWASDPNGINQVGCLYTAQGFEFDYAGVIFGRDLVYDAGWRGNRKISQDSVVKKAAEEEFVNLVKQTYRVLLTRGMKGCYVYFEDAATREFFLSRMRAESKF